LGGLTHLAEVGSTNDWLLARAGELPDGHWVVADRQTAGRGRRGRVWQDGQGNLMASVLVRSRGAVQQLSFVAAVALREAVAEGCGVETRLKWPNDLMVDGAKVSGILLERAGAALVIGFGVNLRGHPEDIGRRAAAVGGEVRAVLAALQRCFAAWRGVWEAAGFAPVRAAWLAGAQGLGEALEVRLGADVLRGVFVGLDEGGALLLGLPGGGTRAIHAGEVFGLEAGHAAGD
jgi:BirA family biotin operon repressor/biotin-[acetyl-CoA-carboxylase] ligase